MALVHRVRGDLDGAPSYWRGWVIAVLGFEGAVALWRIRSRVVFSLEAFSKLHSGRVALIQASHSTSLVCAALQASTAACLPVKPVTFFPR